MTTISVRIWVMYLLLHFSCAWNSLHISRQSNIYLPGRTHSTSPQLIDNRMKNQSIDRFSSFTHHVDIACMLHILVADWEVLSSPCRSLLLGHGNVCLPGWLYCCEVDIWWNAFSRRWTNYYVKATGSDLKQKKMDHGKISLFFWSGVRNSALTSVPVRPPGRPAWQNSFLSQKYKQHHIFK